MIFQPINSRVDRDQPYLVYAQRFDRAYPGTGPHPNSGLYRLKRATRMGNRLGAVVPAARIRCAVEVTPFFGETIERRLTCENSMEASTLFNLNTFSDKETYHLLCR
jgi:hypothetical protein